MAYWTTEEVADFLEITPEKVYESRRRKEYPGNIGKQRGRRLMFDADLVIAGPTEPEITNDPLVALLWTAQGIEAKLVEILGALREKASHDLAETQWHAARGSVYNVTGLTAAEIIRQGREEEE